MLMLVEKIDRNKSAITFGDLLSGDVFTLCNEGFNRVYMKTAYNSSITIASTERGCLSSILQIDHNKFVYNVNKFKLVEME